MCGIVGGTALEQNLLEKALQQIAHRGPDAQGSYSSADGELRFGHVRLSIIDLNAASNQPMVCWRTGNVITFNGEIYNYRSVKQELEQIGWEFRTRSDTEVLLAAYGAWGTDCLKHLNGMFAFAIYDPARRQIFLARDRIGKKPLYYSLHAGLLTFASELKALITARPEIPRIMDDEALNEYMGLGYIPGGLSVFREIRKLKPAHYALYNLRSGGFNAFRYWDLPLPAGESINEDEAAEELEALLVDAVKIRLESDVPVGTFLSGGLDSSLITALAVRVNPDLTALTASFPVAIHDESAVACQVAGWIGVTHHLLPVDAAQWELLDRLARQYDEPLADSSLLPTFMVSEAIRKHVTVALSGDGGDELFAGYGFYDQFMNVNWMENIPLPIRNFVSGAQKIMPLGTRGKNFLRRLPYNGIERFMQFALAPEEIGISPLADDVSQRLNRLPADHYRHQLLNHINQGKTEAPLSLLQQITRLDFYGYLPDDILVKVDRASMLTSLEVRSPLLDYRIAEFAFRLPDRLRFNGGVKKYLLKKIARKYLPPDFPYDRKQGFTIPEAEWFRGHWRSNLDQVAKSGGILNSRNIERIDRLHQRTGRCGRTLFMTTMLAKWQTEYMEHGYGN